MHIRPGEIADSGAIAALLSDRGYPTTANFIASNLPRQLAHPDAEVLVAV